MIRVLLADDQSLVRAGFRALLDSEHDIEVVGEAADGEQAVAQTVALRPDVVLMDIRMPKLDGLGATRRIAEHRTLDAVKVVILTTFELDEYVADFHLLALSLHPVGYACFYDRFSQCGNYNLVLHILLPL